MVLALVAGQQACSIVVGRVQGSADLDFVSCPYFAKLLTVDGGIVAYGTVRSINNGSGRTSFDCTGQVSRTSPCLANHDGPMELFANSLDNTGADPLQSDFIISWRTPGGANYPNPKGYGLGFYFNEAPVVLMKRNGGLVIGFDAGTGTSATPQSSHEGIQMLPLEPANLVACDAAHRGTMIVGTNGAPDGGVGLLWCDGVAYKSFQLAP